MGVMDVIVADEVAATPARTTAPAAPASLPRRPARRVLYLWNADYPWDVRVEKICRAMTDAGHDVHIVARNRGRVKAASRLVGSSAKAILARFRVAMSCDFGTSSSGRAGRLPFLAQHQTVGCEQPSVRAITFCPPKRVTIASIG